MKLHLFNSQIISDYSGYRDYVIVAIPQLDHLDGCEITRTERLQAQKTFQENRCKIIQLQVHKFQNHKNVTTIQSTT